jgi:hypothetical protein
MLGSGHLISGFDVATGSFALMLLGAAVALVGVVALVLFLLRHVGKADAVRGIWAVALILVGGAAGYALIARSGMSERAAERRSVEARASALTARAIAPGSSLACLDDVSSPVIENACEKPLFASPEAVAAAVAYVDARWSLLPASLALAQRDPAYQPMLERLRRGLESDRYGLVAHVLATRGCEGADCAELRLLRDPARVVANMKAHLFEASLGAHALSWPSNGANGSSVVSALQPSPLVSPLTTTGAGPSSPVVPGAPSALSGTNPPATPGNGKFDYPSANSIPAVSIMSAEPGPSAAPAPAEAKPAPAPKRPAVRKQTAREPQRALPAPPPPAEAPQAAPAPAETSGSQ